MISLDDFQTASQKVKQTKHSMLYFGGAKSGKTTLLASSVEVPEMTKLLHLDFGGSSNTLIGDPRFADVITKQVSTIDELTDLFQFLVPSNMAEQLGLSKKDVGNGLVELGVNTIGFDESDRLYTLCMRERMGRAVSENKVKTPFDIRQNDYGYAYVQFLQILDWWMSLPVHFVATSWHSKKTEIATGKEQIRPGLPGKLASEVPGRFHIVGYLDVQSAKKARGESAPTHVLKFLQDGKVGEIGINNAKIRESIGSELINPTMGDIYYAIAGS